MAQVKSKDLFEVIAQVQEQSKELKERLKKDLDIVLLIGDTGSGKSTLFNTLCGAKFEFVANQKGIKQLQVKAGQKIYSEINGGTKSVTSRPIYHFDEKSKHLLIDFPGFKDTRGELQELIIQLMFNKIVTSANVKLVYVIQQPLQQLTNRGGLVKSFFQTFSEQEELKLTDCLFILNKFTLPKVTDDQLIKDVTQQLQEMGYKYDDEEYKMFVMRNIEEKDDKDEEEDEIENMINSSKELWKVLKKHKGIKFSPFNIPKLKVIGRFVKKESESLTRILESYIRETLGYKIKNESLDFVSKLQTIIQNFKVDINSALTSYQSFINLYEQLEDICGNEKKQKSGEDLDIFIKIITFLEDYKDQFEQYSLCFDYLDKIKQLCYQLNSDIDKKIESLEKNKQIAIREEQQKFSALNNQLQQMNCEQKNQVLEQAKKYNKTKCALNFVLKLAELAQPIIQLVVQNKFTNKLTGTGKSFSQVGFQDQSNNNQEEQFQVSEQETAQFQVSEQESASFQNYEQVESTQNKIEDEID